MLILDKPTNHLDPITRKLIRESFKEYERTILMIINNTSFAEAVGIARILVLIECEILHYFMILQCIQFLLLYESYKHFSREL